MRRSMPTKVSMPIFTVNKWCLKSGFQNRNNYIIDWLSTLPYLKLLPLNIPNLSIFKQMSIFIRIIIRKSTQMEQLYAIFLILLDAT